MNQMNNMLRLATMLGWQDVRQAYRRSAVGPFWITGGMAVQIATMGLVFGLIFKTNTHDYLPFLSVSIIVWGYIANSLTEGCYSFIAGEAIIKQLNIPLGTHVLRVVWKNLIALGHNFVILPFVFIAFWHSVSPVAFLAIPGLILLTINLAWITAIVGIFSARFRDLPPIVVSLVTVAFYLTPIMWYPSLIGDNQLAHMLLGFNPLYHLVQIVRLPLLGDFPTVENWLASAALAICGFGLTLYVIGKVKNKIAYWV